MVRVGIYVVRTTLLENAVSESYNVWTGLLGKYEDLRFVLSGKRWSFTEVEDELFYTALNRFPTLVFFLPRVVVFRVLYFSEVD